MNSHLSVREAICAAGYKSVLAKKVYCYVLSDRNVPYELIESLEERIPFFDPSRRGGWLAPNEVVDFGETGHTLEQKFWQFTDDKIAV